MGFGGLVMGTLYRYRVFPWLKDAMTLDHGTWKRTADMAADDARTFYFVGVGCIIASVIWYIVRARNKRYERPVAQQKALEPTR